MRYQSSIVALSLILAGACGGSVTQRTNQALGTALGATNAARDQFTEWDKQHQLDIVDAAKTRESAEAGLSDYRAKRKKIVQAFTVAYTSIASAAATVPLVEAGTKKEKDLLKLLTDSVTAVQVVIGSIADIQKAFGAAEPPAPADPPAPPVDKTDPLPSPLPPKPETDPAIPTGVTP